MAVLEERTPRKWPNRHRRPRARAARAAAWLTTSELAARLGVTNAYISMIENGKRGLTPDLAERWAAALGYDVDALFPEDVEARAMT